MSRSPLIFLSYDRKQLLNSAKTTPILTYTKHSASQKVAKTEPGPQKPPKAPAEPKRSHKAKINSFFKKNPSLAALKSSIPEKYLALKRVTAPENLYLIDDNVAETSVKHILGDIKKDDNHLVCETNAGLGLITARLLAGGVDFVRLYESCSEFKEHLKKKFENLNGRVELCTKDFFLLHRYDYIDRQDNGSRVEQIFKGVPKRNWEDDPGMTVIGPLPNTSFFRFFLKSLVLQHYVASVGRIQLFVFMNPQDFVISTAGPHLNLHAYQRMSVLFKLFFDFELLEKFPREMFLPWHSKTSKIKRYPAQVDPDCIYFVKIQCKRQLPVDQDNLLPLYSFVLQFFGRGKKRIIPTVEKWVPGSGQNLIVPTLEQEHFFRNMSIFTEFGELTPEQILATFKEVTNHPSYERSHFMNIIESQLIKSETVETSLDDHVHQKSLEIVDTEQTL